MDDYLTSFILVDSSANNKISSSISKEYTFCKVLETLSN